MVLDFESARQPAYSEHDMIVDVLETVAFVMDLEHHLFRTAHIQWSIADRKLAIVRVLCIAGYDAGICRSKWRGFNMKEHTYEYIDVAFHQLQKNNSWVTKRLIVDTDFRDHFEIARASEEYTHLLQQLPSPFVGFGHELSGFIQCMCQAAAISFHKIGMGVPPWREVEHMSSLWFSNYKRFTSTHHHFAGYDMCFHYHINRDELYPAYGLICSYSWTSELPRRRAIFESLNRRVKSATLESIICEIMGCGCGFYEVKNEWQPPPVNPKKAATSSKRAMGGLSLAFAMHHYEEGGNDDVDPQ
ncbi:hypothetical protein O6H91_19G069900 [Diphasiastrum complanatum]|uniref:Uncharacterized protein n=1 Tax=Diphasiastrum complanatum TaxID=34168 RepID=A0ACC2AWD6_DIPCM|nr:hypothetical protein O6H91_19G069900 [Diphasiastrum complanatum]